MHAFDSCSPSRSKVNFGVKTTFLNEYILMTWGKHCKDLALEILICELSEGFDKVDSVIFDDLKIGVLNDSAV